MKIQRSLCYHKIVVNPKEQNPFSLIVFQNLSKFLSAIFTQIVNDVSMRMICLFVFV